MLLKTLIDYLNALFHKYDFGVSRDFYLQVGPQQEDGQRVVKKVLLAQYLTKQSIQHANKEKYNFIISNYGLLDNPISRIDEYLQKNLLILLQNRINVGILPPNWYFLPDGPLAFLNKILVSTYGTARENTILPGAGYIYTSQTEMSLELLLSNLHRFLQVQTIQAAIIHDITHKILLIPPQTMNSLLLKKAKYQGCDCIICSEFSSDIISVLNCYELSYIQIPFHEVNESMLKRFCSTLALEFPRISFGCYPSDPILKQYHWKQNH